MTNTAGTIIDTAREMAAPYGQGPMPIPEMALIRWLGMLDRRVVGQIAREAPESLSASGTADTVTAAENLTGYSLTAGGLSYRDFRYITSENITIPIRIVPLNQKIRPPSHPAAIVQGSKLYPCDPSGRDWLVNSGVGDSWWKVGDTFDWRYVALPTIPSTRASTLSSPDMCEQYFIASVYRMVLQLNRAPQDMVEVAVANETAAKSEMGISLMKAYPKQSSFGGYRTN